MPTEQWTLIIAFATWVICIAVFNIDWHILTLSSLFIDYIVKKNVNDARRSGMRHSISSICSFINNKLFVYIKKWNSRKWNGSARSKIDLIAVKWMNQYRWVVKLKLVECILLLCTEISLLQLALLSQFTHNLKIENRVTWTWLSWLRHFVCEYIRAKLFANYHQSEMTRKCFKE